MASRKSARLMTHLAGRRCVPVDGDVLSRRQRRSLTLIAIIASTCCGLARRTVCMGYVVAGHLQIGPSHLFHLPTRSLTRAFGVRALILMESLAREPAERRDELARAALLELLSESSE